MKENEFVLEKAIKPQPAMSIREMNTSQLHEKQSIILVTVLCLREEITAWAV